MSDVFSQESYDSQNLGSYWKLEISAFVKSKPFLPNCLKVMKGQSKIGTVFWQNRQMNLKA